MPDRAFFDTNVLIYTAVEDPRGTRAEELLRAGGVISVQILNEFVSVARRNIKMSWTDIGEALTAICIVCPSQLPLTIESHEAARTIAEKYG